MSLADKAWVAYGITVTLYAILLVICVALKAAPKISDLEDMFYLSLIGLSPPFNLLFIAWFLEEIRGELASRWRVWRELRKTEG